MTLKVEQNELKFTGNIAIDPILTCENDNSDEPDDGDRLFFRIIRNQVRFDEEANEFVDYYVQDGEKVQLKPFSFGVQLRGKSARHYATVLNKGMHVLIIGSLRHDTNKDGNFKHPYIGIDATGVYPTLRFITSIERMQAKNGKTGAPDSNSTDE